MALIAFPQVAAARIVAQELRWVHLGQVVHRGLYDGRQQVLTRAPGFLAGTLTVSTTEFADGDRLAVLMERYLAALHGSSNTTALPLQAARVPVVSGLPAEVHVSESLIDVGRGDILFTLADGDGNALDAGAHIAAGGYCSIDGRCYSITGALDDSTIRCYPPVAPADDNSLVELAAPVIQARLTGESPMMRGTGDEWGPWTIEFEEAF